jgi:hypothetical protein
VVQKRFNFPENTVELYAEKVNNRGLCAIAQAESLRYKLLGGLAVRRACYGVLRFIMESGAKGCEVRRWRPTLVRSLLSLVRRRLGFCQWERAARRGCAELLGKRCQKSRDLLGLWTARDPLYSLGCQGSLPQVFALLLHEVECRVLCF